jgi:hypothetical protein
MRDWIQSAGFTGTAPNLDRTVYKRTPGFLAIQKKVLTVKVPAQ